ncbi:hypothetical protein COI88_27910 [Bacillus cereus]|nr:hypothetical protein COI88_27910 [Bacillus cereus]
MYRKLEGFMFIVLEELSNSKELTLQELIHKLAEVHNEYYENPKRFYKNISWAITYLKKAYLIRTIGRGKYSITERGIKVIFNLKNEESLPIQYLIGNFDEFNVWHKGRKDSETITIFINIFESTEECSQFVEINSLKIEISRDTSVKELLASIESSQINITKFNDDNFKPIIYFPELEGPLENETKLIDLKVTHGAVLYLLFESTTLMADDTRINEIEKLQITNINSPEKVNLYSSFESIKNVSISGLFKETDKLKKILKGRNSKRLSSILLYTSEDTELCNYIRNHYPNLNKNSGEILDILVFDELPKNIISKSQNWRNGVLERINKILKKFILKSLDNDLKTFHQSEIYDHLHLFGIYRDQLPCLLILNDPENLKDNIPLTIRPEDGKYSTTFRNIFGKIERSFNDKDDKFLALKESFEEVVELKALNKLEISEDSIEVIDVLILTALTEEFEGLKNNKLVDNWSLHSVKGYPYYKGKLIDSKGVERHLALVYTGMGEVDASTAASNFVNLLSPKMIAMCGICAGDKNKVELGDIIVAESVFKIEKGKRKVNVVLDPSNNATESMEIIHYKELKTYNFLKRQWKDNINLGIYPPQDWYSQIDISRPKSYAHQEWWLLNELYNFEECKGIDPRLNNDRSLECNDWTDILTRLEDSGLITINKTGISLTEKGKELVAKIKIMNKEVVDCSHPKVFVAPIATSDYVQEDPEIFKQLQNEINRKILGLEMEGTGIGAVAEYNSLPVIFVKSVSDLADNGKNNKFHDYCSHVSACFLLMFLKHCDYSII